MIQKYVIYIILFGLGSMFASCKKELNVYPTTSEVDGNVIVDAKSAATVLNGVYYRFAGAGEDYNKFPSLNWSDYNESTPSQLSGMADYAGGGSDLNLFSFDYFNVASYLFWNYNYALVNAANGFLKNVAPVTKIPDLQKKQMLAEAMFLRAFANTNLLLYFGQYNDPGSKYGILLRTEFVNADNINLPRSTVADSYAAILSDLDFAMANLPAKNTQIYYANLWAAKLLKARLLINRAGQGDYSQVIALANDIIKNGPFQLEENLKDLFLSKAFNSKEIIMGVQPYPNENYKYTIYQLYFQYAGTQEMVDLFKGDPRNQWIYKAVIDPYYGTLYQLTKYYSGDVDPDKLAPTPYTEYAYAFRLTEAYLLKAEAIALSHGDLSEAKTLLKTVESHAGITDFSQVNNSNNADDLQELIVREEMKNFVIENGVDWFALRRLPMKRLQAIRPEIKSNLQLILPVPYGEIPSNKNITQIPGYDN